MESTTVEVPVHYNPNQLVTYKVIDGDSVTYPTDKVTTLEYTLDQSRRTLAAKNELQSKINRIIDNMTLEYWYNPNTDKETVLQDLCDILEHEPKQSIVISATIDIEIEVDLPLQEVEDFDTDDYVAENLSIDCYSGDGQILNWDVRHTEMNS